MGQRTSCPTQNDQPCNGHGVCQSNIDFHYGATVQNAQLSNVDTDAERLVITKNYLGAWDSGLQLGACVTLASEDLPALYKSVLQEVILSGTLELLKGVIAVGVVFATTTQGHANASVDTPEMTAALSKFLHSNIGY